MRRQHCIVGGPGQNDSMPDYQLINPPAFTKKSRTEKFIYVLMFGVPGLPSAPFYVGKTSGLTGRFGSHSMLVWHHAKFGAVARIWVAGSVRTMDADLAEQDLITMLSDAGHLLTNTAITQSRVNKVQAAGDCGSWMPRRLAPT